ncbi:MAG: hypothetical protein DME19_01350, partial [Verrucomicrobia bacterium]
MPLFTAPRHRRDEIVAIDFGYQVTKAVHVRRGGSGIRLLKYVLIETPIYEKSPSRELLTDHFKAVVTALGATGRPGVIAIGAGDSWLSHAELPASNASDLRKMIKLSPKTYLQQDLPDFLFDCYLKTVPGESGGTTRTRRKAKVLVGGAKRRLVETFQEAARDAGLVVEEITLSQIGVVNALRALPSDSHAEVAALLDIGANHSSIGVLMNGELALTRLVNVGAGKLADFFGKTGTADLRSGKMDEFQAKVHGLISTLSKELSASIDFFETQSEAKVTEIVVSGGVARSQFILQSLEAELEIPCETWTPAKCRELELPERQKNEVDYEGPQLAVAVGLGLGSLDPNSIRINLLAEEREVAEMRRRDPVRRARWASTGAVFLMLLWAGFLGLKIQRAGVEVKRYEDELQVLQKNSGQAIATAKMAVEMGRTLTSLKQLAANRYFFAPALGALQYTTVPNVQFHHLSLVQSVVSDPGVKAVVENGQTVTVGKAGVATEKTQLVIQGRDFSDAKTRTIDKAVQAIAGNPYFKEHLRK